MHPSPNQHATHAVHDGTKPIVTYKPKPRDAPPPPPDVPVKHSSAYILKDRKSSNGRAETSKPSTQSASRSSGSEDLSGNAFEWALKQADAYFDRVESEAATNRQAQLIVKNPGTQVTMKAMQGVTAFGAAAAPQIIKVAVPVGKKLLVSSAEVLMAGLGAMNSAPSRKPERKSESKPPESKPPEEGGQGRSDAGGAGGGRK